MTPVALNSVLSGSGRIAHALWILVLIAIAVPATMLAGPIISVHLDGFNPDPYAVFGRSVVDPATNTRINSNAMDGGRFAMTVTDPGNWDGDLITGDTFYAFCIEPREFVSLGATTHTSCFRLRWAARTSAAWAPRRRTS